MLNRRIDRIAEPLDDGVDLIFADNEGRRDQRMIAARAVNRAAGRIDQQAACHSLFLDARVQLRLRLERRFRAAIRDELKRLKQPATANIADVGVIAARSRT